jgi:hypothetical protein
MQRKLYRWSRNDPQRAFSDLFNLVCDRRNLFHAWQQLSRNQGSRTPGVDGVTRRKIEERPGGVLEYLEEIRQALRDGTYHPQPVRQRLIPKPGKPGKFRPLGIPTLNDRLVQMALKNVLEPIFEADFYPTSYPFSKTSVHLLLTNVLYAGNITYRDEVHPGEHPAIVDEGLWQQAQDFLRLQRRAREERNLSGALLKGLLYCRPCGRAMTPAHSSKSRGRRYRYYTCTGAQKLGWHTCPNPSVAATAMEQIVCEHLGQLGHQEPSVQALLGPTWPAREPAAQARLLGLLVARVDYAGGSQDGEGKLAITLQPDGLQRLAQALKGEPV